jgi:multiple sugar transport system permease protein
MGRESPSPFLFEIDKEVITLPQSKGYTNRRKRSEWLTAYTFLMPNLVGLTLFVFVPIVYAFYVSLHKWNLLSAKKFVGFDNYQHLLTDTQWWHSLYRTFIFSIIYVPALFVFSLLFAVMINALKGRVVGFVRTTFLMPFAITSVISAVIWMFLLDPRNGYINQFLNMLGVDNQQFLGSTSQAMYAIVAVILWINLGYNMMIFMSAIKEIPRDYYEAATLDGAGSFQIFRSITFPLIRDTSTFILIVSTIASFQVLEQIMVMTRGGPAKATEVSVLYIYQQSFDLLNLGYGSALSFVLFLIIFVLSMIQLKFFSAK